MTTLFANAQDLYEENDVYVSSVKVTIKIGRLEVITTSADTRFTVAASVTSGSTFLEKIASNDMSDYCLAHVLTYKGEFFFEEIWLKVDLLNPGCIPSHSSLSKLP